jgi:hypothetical protein
MDHEIAKGDVLGRLQCALDLIHGIDAPGLVRVQYIHAKTTCAAHFAVSIQRGVHGERLQRVPSEPLGELCHILATGVVEVLARGKNLHCLRAGAIRKLEQTGMQAMVQE